MDWATDARRNVLDSLQDLHDAEAVLATLQGGSHDHLLMADTVARLSLAADRAVRKQALRAALFDAAALSVTEPDEYRSTYDGQAPAEYLRVLGECLAGVRGRLENGPSGFAAVFKGHRIAIDIELASRQARTGA
jgi:hypothetical protein